MNRINRINYIVQENPEGVASTLKGEGINPSSDIKELTGQTKAWIQKEGKTAVVKLLQVHPEKRAILSAHQSGFVNYGGCGCKSSFDGSPCPCSSKSSYSVDGLSDLEAMDERELGLHYKDLKRLLKQFPDDEELRKEVETVWQLIRSNSNSSRPDASQKEGQVRRNDKQAHSKEVFSVTSKDLAVGSFIFGIALIISQIR
jgi:hypothetical protein